MLFIIACTSTCATCSSSSSCQSCNSGYGLINNSCVTCSAGTYTTPTACVGIITSSNLELTVIIACLDSCANCTNSSSCQACKPGQLRSLAELGLPMINFTYTPPKLPIAPESIASRTLSTTLCAASSATPSDSPF